MSLSAAGIRRIAVAMQAATACGIGAALVWLVGWGWAAALAAGVLVVLAGLGLGIAQAFVLTKRGFGIRRADLPPAAPSDVAACRRPLRAPEALACYLAEYAAVFRMFNWLQPFLTHRQFAETSPGRDAPTVLLVHGYACNHAVWLDLQPALAAAGYRCEAIDLEPVFGGIDDYAAVLLDRMRAIATQTGRPPLLVCHSMGGLAARAAMVLGGTDEICSGAVTLGSPHHGCALARFGTGRNAEQMRCGNDWLEALAAAESPRLRGRLVSIFSWHDSISGPACTSWLDGAHHIALTGIGHVSLLRHPRAVAAVLEALDTLSTRAR
jgi:triacylglycerol esterase/lipase EstA (alpha/beta hydrolase family)